MSSTLSGIIVLENPQPLDGSPRTIEFEGQVWLSTGNVLTGKFRYFNTWDYKFEDVGHYLAWIHVVKAVPIGDRNDTNTQSTPEQGESSDHGSGTVTLCNDFHVYGDIVQLIQILDEYIRNPPYAMFTGAAFDCNKANNTFDINVNQYTSFYKTQRHLSMMPVRAHFDNTKYKNKKPMPSNNTYVGVEGFVTHIDVDPNTGHATLLHIMVENISFLGKAVVAPSTPTSSSAPSTPHSQRFKFKFNDHPSGSTEGSQSTPSSSTVPETPSKRQPKRTRAE